MVGESSRSHFAPLAVQLAIGRVGPRGRGLEHRAHWHRSQYRAKPAHMVEVRMRRHQHVDGFGAFALKQRHDPALAGVEALIAWPGIDDDEMPVGCAQYRSVTLAHVHKMQRQPARARLRHPEVGYQCDPHARRPGQQQPA